jgi:cell division cycle 14
MTDTATDGQIIHHHIFDRMFLCETCPDSLGTNCDRRYEYFRLLEDSVSYSAFEDEFGPMNLANIHQFCLSFDAKLRSSELLISMVTPCDRKALTTSIFLLGSYMILSLNYDLATVLKSLEFFIAKTIFFSNVTRSSSNFGLQVQDCLAGLFKAKSFGWVDFQFGGFDAAEYSHLDSPLNANLHEVLPGKFVVMRGPRDLPNGALWRDTSLDDGSFSHREFSPAHYAEILIQFDVQAVVRLNAPQYDRAGFEAAGIAVIDLFIEDGAPPPVLVIAKFLAVAELLPGVIAVHCGSGLGRSGTLVALYMMKHHGFTAREAMGWLRVVRPGRSGLSPRVLGSPPLPPPSTQSLARAWRSLEQSRS